MKPTTRIRRQTITSPAPKQGTRKPAKPPAEFKIVRLRECPVADAQITEPAALEKFWRQHVVTAPWFNVDKECLVVFLLNVRRRLLGFELLSQGTKDTLLVNPAEVFRLAAARNAAAILVAHNHPSGDPSPSEADIRVTRDLIRAGQTLKIELLDHVIIGRERSVSLRSMGYFYGGQVASTESQDSASPAVPEAANPISPPAPPTPPTEIIPVQAAATMEDALSLFQMRQRECEVLALLLADEMGAQSNAFAGWEAFDGHEDFPEGLHGLVGFISCNLHVAFREYEEEQRPWMERARGCSATVPVPAASFPALHELEKALGLDHDIDKATRLEESIAAMKELLKLLGCVAERHDVKGWFMGMAASEELARQFDGLWEAASNLYVARVALEVHRRKAERLAA